MNQAISLAGGVKFLKRRIEFVRFNREGTIDRRIFAYNPAAAADAPNNPVLASGDLIRVNDSLLSGSINVLNELTGPFVGLYSVYSLFNRAMTTQPMENEPNPSFTTRTDDEINLRQVYGALRRRKSLILKITAATILSTGIYAFTRRPVWEGQFEIVLASVQSPSSQASSLLQSNPRLANLIGASGGKSQLATEVLKSLESPSVLKPVFDFVKQQKQQQGIDIQDWRYADWLKENLTIELVKGTTVLELAYRDTDKDLVLPVIQKISEAYQDYSGRDRERGINQAIQYLDQQIEIYSQKKCQIPPRLKNMASNKI